MQLLFFYDDYVILISLYNMPSPNSSFINSSMWKLASYLQQQKEKQKQRNNLLLVSNYHTSSMH